MIYQYYDPHPHICRMQQYTCCKFHTDCPLYHRCQQMKGYEDAGSVCKRDCPSCDYRGCTMSMARRKTHPIYMNGNATTKALSHSIEIEWEREHNIHLHTHRKNYVLYNQLFGDLKEKQKAYQYEYYRKDIEYSRQRSRERYRKSHPITDKKYTGKYIPECGFKCEKCKHEDCILPQDWNVKARQEAFNAKHPNYWSEYYKSHKEERSSWAKAYYQEHREEIREKQRLARLSNPNARAKSNEYNRKYYHLHKEEIQQRRQEKKNSPEEKERQRAYQRAYREAHREEHNAYERQYYEAHKEEINAKKRQQRQKPEIKEKRAEYNRKYQQEHPELYQKSAEKYRKNHPDKIRESRLKYYHKNKAAINAKRAMKRAEAKMQRCS